MVRTMAPGQTWSPYIVEELARHGLAAERVEDHVLGMPVSARLRRRKEPGADQRTLGAEHERRGQASPVGDPARSQDRNPGDDIDHHRHQRQRRHHPDVTPALRPLEPR